MSGTGTEVDVAVHLLDGTVRLSILWTQEVLLSADDAEQVAQALLRAAKQARSIPADHTPGSTTSRPGT
ncbi:hypothetical protein [Streptomyces sp. AK08-02]|uniref:hypothetical protein n=1 Tax=Streptomyces sp. AK08-02 TaxID=3028654 RepID=UPI0029BC98B6|nr:hypothetical protein [Streptomyces sp. AK08-02]MDX3752694.1 hypothetical protein [Streptomyces sp. AK08-02]